MKVYLEKFLKREIGIDDFDKNRLPLMLSGSYDLYVVSVESFRWVAIKPKFSFKLEDLRKHIQQFEFYTDLDCAYVFDKISPYIKTILMEEGIPFVIVNKEIYLPFTGLMLSTKKARILKPVHEISFLTQKLILSALYEKWNLIGVTEIAKIMNVTKTSVSRCMDEIEYCNLSLIVTRGSRRYICIDRKPEVIWNEIKDILRSPVIRVYDTSTETSCGLSFKAGISALSEYTMLADNSYLTYGVLKKDIKSLGVQNAYKDLMLKQNSCRIHELGYMIEFQGKKIMDPLSIVLSLSDEELEDDRISIAIDEMLEEYVW